MRAVTNTVATLAQRFYVVDDLTDATGAVTVTATAVDGSVFSTGTATRVATGLYCYALPAMADPDLLTITWSGVFSGAPTIVTNALEVMADRLTSVAEVRTLDGMDDQATFSDTLVEQACEFAEDVVADFCGSMWVRRLAVDSFRMPLREPNRERLFLQSPLAASIRWVSFDGVREPDLSVYHLEDHASSLFRDYRFPRGVTVEVGYEHGPAASPEGVRWAARTMARHYLLALESRIPDRALSIQSDFGNIMLAQPGAVGRPTALPEVNAVLARYRVRGY